MIICLERARKRKADSRRRAALLLVAAQLAERRKLAEHKARIDALHERLITYLNEQEGWEK